MQRWKQSEGSKLQLNLLSWSPFWGCSTSMASSCSSCHQPKSHYTSYWGKLLVGNGVQSNQMSKCIMNEERVGGILGFFPLWCRGIPGPCYELWLRETSSTCITKTLHNREGLWPLGQGGTIAVVFVVKKFHRFLFRRYFKICTDHKPPLGAA